MRAIAISLIFGAILVGCTKAPTGIDIQPFLAETIAKDTANIVVHEPQLDTSKDGDKFKVKFKTSISPKEDFFERVDSVQVFKEAGWDESTLAASANVLAKLSTEIQEKLKATRPKSAADIIFLKRASEKNTQGQWYGATDCAYYVDKWGCTNVVTDSQTKFKGKPKISFGDGNGIVLDSAEGKQALAALIAERMKFLAQLKLSEDFERQAAAARSEQEAKEANLQQQLQEESAKRLSAENTAIALEKKMPVELKLRPAINGKGKVLHFTNISPKEMTLDISASNGSSEKNWRVIVPALKFSELGWLEGWAFSSGDEVKISNPNFNQIRIRIR